MHDDLPIHVAPDARFACHRCGACCERVPGVELLAGDRERLERHDWASEGARFARGFVEPRIALGGVAPTGPDRLKVVEGRCIFLDPDKLCRVEKRLGREAKPARCRAFPLRFASTPDGLHVSVSVECQSAHRGYQDDPLVEPTAEVRELAAALPRLLVLGQRFVLRHGEPARLAWSEVYAILEDAAAQATVEGEPLAALPRALLRAVRRAMREPVPATPWSFEGPADVPFYQCLDYLGGELAPIARQHGLGRMAGAFAEMRRYQVWRRAADKLAAEGTALPARPEPEAGAAGRFLRHVLRALILELRPVQLGQVVAGLGAALYLTLGVGTGAVQRAEVERRGARPSAADVNLVAEEAAQLFRVRPFVDAMAVHALALERLIFDA